MTQPLGEVVERHELYPLVPGQIRRIREIVGKPFMDIVIRTFFGTADENVKYAAFAKLSERLAQMRKEFHPSDLPLVNLYAREELSANKWTSSRNVRRSHLDWIQMMTDWVRSETKPGTFDYLDYFDTLSRYLGIRLLGQRYEEKPPTPTRWSWTSPVRGSSWGCTWATSASRRPASQNGKRRFPSTSWERWPASGST